MIIIKNEGNKNNNNIISENNYEDKDEVYINFTGNISVIQNCNNTTIKNNKIILLIGLLIVVLA